MEQDLISIIVLAYNTEKYIEQCLKSIKNQTYANLEIIVILDGCTDHTKNIVRRLAKGDERIRMLVHENMGTCFCRIEGYLESQGKYIMYVDSDDYIELNMVELMHHKLKEYKVDLVHCQYKDLKGQEIKIPKNILNRNVKMNVEELEPQFFDLLYNTNNCNSICRELIRKKVMKGIEKIDKTLLYNEDLACNLHIYKQMKSILFIPDELYVCRKNINGISRSTRIEILHKKINDTCQVHYDLYNAVNDFGIQDKKRYKQMACIKLLMQLTFLFYQIEKKKKYNKDEYISYITTVCSQDSVKEMFRYFKKYPNEIELKKLGKVNYQSALYLLERQYTTLYKYYKWKYQFILLIEQKWSEFLQKWKK